MIRGIERRNIFNTDYDKKDFLKRLGKQIQETDAICFAFSIMSNHLHLLIQSGTTPLSAIMQSLQTGYAVSYNLRHKRAGKLYQNRFKSVLCDKEEYLLHLVRYIHLNPLKAKILTTMQELDKNPWTSHSIYMGKETQEWLETEEVLCNFGKTEGEARKEYREFVKSGLELEDPIDFDGGGLIRSMGGIWETLKESGSKKRRKEAADERILGNGTFVENILKEADQQESTRSRLQRKGWDLDKVTEKINELFELKPGQLEFRGKGDNVSKGRALLCKWMIKDMGMLNKEMAEHLGVSSAAISQMVRRGSLVQAELGVDLV